MHLQTNSFRLFGVTIRQSDANLSPSSHHSTNLDHFLNQKSDINTTTAAATLTSVSARSDNSISMPAKLTSCPHSLPLSRKLCRQPPSPINKTSKKSKTNDLTCDGLNNAKGKKKVEDDDCSDEACYVFIFGVGISKSYKPENKDDEMLKHYESEDTSKESTSRSASSTVINAQPLKWCFPQSPYYDQFYDRITTTLGGDKDSVKLILHKVLQVTDVNGSQSRLSLPKNKLLVKGFLTDAEEEWLSKKDQETNKLNKLEVIVLDPALQIWDGNRSLHISRWNYSKKANGIRSWSYVLKTNWNKLKTQNHLEQGHVIQAWCFRAHGKLGLALVRI